jgi:outer membrane protein assembly factor BamB
LARKCRACGKELTASAEWPVFRKSPALDAFSPSALEFDSVSASDHFERLWPVGQLRSGEEVVAPLVLDHGLLVICTRAGTMYILNRFSGERLAELKLGDEESFALISGRVLVAASGRRVVAYDLLAAFRAWNAGRFRLTELWEKTLESGAILQPLNRSGQGLEALLVWAGDPEQASIHCLDIGTGEERWKSPAMIASPASAVVADHEGNAYVVTGDSKVLRIAFDCGQIETSKRASRPLRVDVAPAWVDSTLFFFDEEGVLSFCRTDNGMIPTPASDLAFFGVRGFATSPRGILVAHGQGLSKLSLSGQLIWSADGSMTGMSSSPLLAGDCGFGVTEERSVLCLCDFKGSALRFHQFAITDDLNLAPPAFAGRSIYTCSFHGEVSGLKVKTTN